MIKDVVISPVQTQNLSGPQKPVRLRTEAGSIEPPAQVENGKELPSNSVSTAIEPNLSGVVESLNDYLQSVKRDLEFSVDSATGRTIITVMDRDSGETIRQIPPETVMALAEYLRSEGGLENFGVAEKA